MHDALERLRRTNPSAALVPCHSSLTTNHRKFASNKTAPVCCLVTLIAAYKYKRRAAIIAKILYINSYLLARHDIACFITYPRAAK
jgi:hypothetical protein